MFSQKVSLSSSECFNCKKEFHPLYTCKKFLDFTPEERRKTIAKAQICYNCLHFYHLAKNCTYRSKCKFCNKRHHALLHVNERNERQMGLLVNALNISLRFAVAIVTNPSTGKSMKVNVLLDDGATISMLAIRVARELGIEGSEKPIVLCGINGSKMVGSMIASVKISPCLLYTSPSPRDKRQSRMPSSA